MIKVRKQNEEENLIHGDSFPVTVIIGDTTKYLTEKAFNELKTELNKFAIPNVVGQIEQLNAFLDYCDEAGWIKNIDKDRVIDDYTKSL